MSKELWKITFAITLAVLLLCPVVGCLGIVIRVELAERQPSDAQMIDHFRDHRSKFDALTKMVWEDRGRIGDVSVDEYKDVGPDSVTPARLQEYRRLLADAGLSEMTVTDEQTIEFVYHTGSTFAYSVNTKGYLYLPDAPPDSGPQPDLGGGSDNRQGTRRIDGHWYLYYSENHW